MWGPELIELISGSAPVQSSLIGHQEAAQPQHDESYVLLDISSARPMVQGL